MSGLIGAPVGEQKGPQQIFCCGPFLLWRSAWLAMVMVPAVSVPRTIVKRRPEANWSHANADCRGRCHHYRRSSRDNQDRRLAIAAWITLVRRPALALRTAWAAGAAFTAGTGDSGTSQQQRGKHG